MKPLLLIIQSKKFQVSFLLTLSLLWIIGPYLALAGKTPFGTAPQRIIASIAAFFLLLAIELFRANKIAPTTPDFSDELQQELYSIQTTIKDVFRTLYQNVFKILLLRYRKPWFLVLGPTNAGKTTFLNKAELNLRDLNDQPLAVTTSTKNFSWWLADDAVFIDVGGRYLKETKNNSHDTIDLFKGFAKLLKRYRAYKPINGLLVTVNLQELTVNPREHNQLLKLGQIIKDLMAELNEFPIYLIITRCDYVDGFAEFFEDLSSEERNQTFGLSFPLTITPNALPELFNEQFNALLTRLNEKVITRLNKENSLDKIGKIKNFPLQMECLKNSLAKLLNILLPSSTVNLRGIFFTSASQRDVPIDNLAKPLMQAYDIAPLNQNSRAQPAKTYFITDLIKKLILPETKFYSSHHPNKKIQGVGNVLIITLTILCAFFLYHSYQYNRAVITTAQQAIAQSATKQLTGNPLIEQLDLLQKVMTQLSAKPEHWYSNISLQQSQKLEKKVKAVYLQLLSTQFLPYIKSSIETQLENVKEENSNQLYASLKTYLMLNDHTHLDKKYILSWFENYWHQTGQNDHLTALDRHLTTLLSQPFKPVLLDERIIENTRALLNNMPQSRLVLTILQNQYQRSSVQILPDAAASLFTTIPREISGIYDIRNFRNVYYAEIEKTCQEITNGNWVLAKKAQPAFSDIALNQLASEVKAIYINEYAVTWSDILAKIKMDQFENLTQIINAINLLNNPQSPLVQLINTIKNNTQPISDSADFTQQVSTRFLALNGLSSDLLKNTNQTSLVGVKDYLNRIILSPDSLKASYDAAKIRMENQNGGDVIANLLQQARMLPEPLRTWHTTVAAESWRIILQNTQGYLNRIWVAMVYPQYAAVLNNRYPLFKESTVDVSMNDFANFFGNNGVMDTFFKTYLQPFVDNSRLYWEWKNVDGQRINISQPTLEMFIRAAMIQKMFFPDDSKQPTIAFSLVPVELGSGVHSFTLDLEGQQAVFQKDNEQILSFTWPGPSPGHTSLTFSDDQGKKTISETGAWAWFKILDKSKLESTANPKHFRLTFGTNATTVQYDLYATGIVNPFLPGILSGFRCPENL